MKAFDFDNTLYRGESPVDLYLFTVRENKRILLYLPVILIYIIKYKLCIADRDQLQKMINKYVKKILQDRHDVREITAEFWKKNERKLDEKMLARVEQGDLIISAGPSFLLDGIKHRLNTENVISSEVDLEKNEITFFNFKDNKIKRYKEMFGDQKIEIFYSDSYNDRPMMEISDQVFLVRRGKIKKIK